MKLSLLGVAMSELYASHTSNKQIIAELHRNIERDTINRIHA